MKMKVELDGMKVELEGEPVELTDALARMHAPTKAKMPLVSIAKEVSKPIYKRRRLSSKRIRWHKILGMSIMEYAKQERSKGTSRDKVISFCVKSAKAYGYSMSKRKLNRRVVHSLANANWVEFSRKKAPKAAPAPVIGGNISYTRNLGMTLSKYARIKIAAGYSPKEIQDDVMSKLKGKYRISEKVLSKKIYTVVNSIRYRLKRGKAHPIIPVDGTPIAAFTDDTDKMRE